MTDTLHESLYYLADPSVREEYFAFRKETPTQVFTDNKLEWHYIRTGQGDRTLVFLVGGLQHPDGFFRHINAFKDRFQILAPDYPNGLKAIQITIDALAIMLDREKVKKADFVGTSLGGMLLQAFLHAHPERVERAIIGDTFPPEAGYGHKLENAAKMLHWVPLWFINGPSLRRLKQHATSAPEQERTFWEAYMEEHWRYRTKKSWLINHRLLAADFCLNSDFTPEDLQDWPGRLLLVESMTDIVGAKSQLELRRLYPKAETYTFQGDAGHAPAITRPEEYRRMITDFLAS